MYTGSTAQLLWNLTFPKGNKGTPKAVWVEDLLLEDHAEGENKVGSGCG